MLICVVVERSNRSINDREEVFGEVVNAFISLLCMYNDHSQPTTSLVSDKESSDMIAARLPLPSKERLLAALPSAHWLR